IPSNIAPYDATPSSHARRGSHMVDVRPPIAAAGECVATVLIPWPSGLDDAMHPAVRVVCAAILHIEKRAADLARHRAGLGAHRQLTAVPHKPAEWRNDRSGAAREDLGDLAGRHAVAPVVDRD